MHNRYKTQGAALIVGLILMTAMTLVGVSSMRSAALDLRIAHNARIRQVVFQAAGSLIDQVMETPALYPQDENTPTDISSFTLIGANNLNVTFPNSRFNLIIPNMQCPLNSLSQTSCQQYEIEVNASTVGAVTSRSSQRQGFWRLVPKQ